MQSLVLINLVITKKKIMKIKTIATILLIPLMFACIRNSKISKSDYKLVWSDDFNINGLVDSTKWSYDTVGNSWGWGNDELQWYTAKKTKNAEVIDGFLYIRAVKEKTNGKEYSSARIITKGKGDWLYGKVEVRAKVPGCRGIWPAIWMLSSDNSYGTWPASGEIDIMEHVGYIPDSVYASTHCQKYYFKIGTQKTKGFYIPDCDKGFHTYTMEWDPEQISIFCDDTKYFNFKNEHKTFQEWPFDKSFYLILNVAVGGAWGGVKGVDTTSFPQTMIVDYVKVYQK